MITLDEHEQQALDQFVTALEHERFESHPMVDRSHLSRGAEGQIVVPVAVPSDKPDLHLAMLMIRKAEQLYKQTGCRFVLAQKPAQDPRRGAYIWADSAWRALP
jgi:hypothetical protein